jgi:hypothetical protein
MSIGREASAGDAVDQTDVLASPGTQAWNVLLRHISAELAAEYVARVEAAAEATNYAERHAPSAPGASR